MNEKAQCYINIPQSVLHTLYFAICFSLFSLFEFIVLYVLKMS